MAKFYIISSKFVFLILCKPLANQGEVARRNIPGSCDLKKRSKSAPMVPGKIKMQYLPYDFHCRYCIFIVLGRMALNSEEDKKKKNNNNNKNKKKKKK
ncbi:hypothetical protein ElyMa_000129500 [Elysia marginata]|uniref:Secreted protein n=1 Tax=Elysia marginata TaxID=1093978 RepID=A0AAV4ENT6_9GAST|nr:hypothetical protein ElyMa_000129500 [Elysia marginata]